MRPAHFFAAAPGRAVTGALLVAALYGSLVLAGCSTTSQHVATQDNRAVQDYFGLINSVKKEQPELVEALIKFPKGADLHNHLSGSVMPEDFIALGKADGDCFGPDPRVPEQYTLAAATSPGDCPDGFKPLTRASREEEQQLLRSLSMYQFNDNGLTSIRAGHDQFFATFGRFGAISGAADKTGPMLAKLLQQEHGEGVSYVETMMSFQSAAVSRLANQLRVQYPDVASFAQSSNYPEMYAYLLSAGLHDILLAAQKDVATAVNSANALLQCATSDRDPACAVLFAFQATVNRNAALPDGSADLPKIFTQTALSCLLAATDSRVLGVNLLSGEDAPVSMKNFSTQMQFFSYFHSKFPRVNIALHGGEITPAFVGSGNPALKDHLSGSIQAGAKRLGHAVSFSYLSEADKTEVVNLLRQNNTAVEINFTSNAQILGVTGDEHPFPQYFRRFAIPVVLATDDAGVSHASFTDEWLYATRHYRITYPEAVQLARTSLQYSFLPGAPLWQSVAPATVVSQCAGEILGSPAPGEPCKSYLSSSEKAGRQWIYEGQLVAFDKAYGATVRKHLGN